MSMINEELQRQQDKDIGAAIRKVFGDGVPTIDAKEIEAQEEARKSLDEKLQRLQQERARAESAKR